MKKTIYIALALALLAALGATGCGSDSEASVSKAEFVEQANKICLKTGEAQYNESVDYARKNKNELAGLTGEQVQKKIYLTVALPLIPKEAKELEALGAPDGDEQTIEKLIAEIEKGVEGAKKDPGAIDGIDDPFKNANKMAREYGLKLCTAFG